ncbi:MAG: VWA domain-containing protein [Ignavibacteriaceae bacterium]|nr:VWA domain-containing protein [Ignavibacteriaceae bacterium]MCU0364309.1 VWA domain-containing protein [Ignavibacteriaceae bacterium]
MFSGITFAYPWILYFLLIIPLMIAWYIFRGMKVQSSVTYSSINIFKDVPATFRERLRHIPFAVRLIAIALLIIALARPQSFTSGENVTTEGIDIAMVLDISGSMLAEDFKPNRLEAAKNVIDNFVEGRTSDRIGLVIFSREAFTQCPLTIDYNVLRNLLLDIRSGIIQDGTAIGNAIANGVNRLKESDAKSRIIILLTDGVNNAGEVDPRSAADIAKAFGIRIYTIGVGTRGEAPYPVQTPFGTRYQMVPVEIDEALLSEIAEITGGQYFRATNNRALAEIYEKIDKLEKTKIEITSYKNASEKYLSWLWGGLILLLVELGLSRTILRKLP